MIPEGSGEKLAEELKIPYFECSALSGEGVKDVFHEIATEYVRTYVPPPITNGVLVSLEVKKSKCC